MKALPHDPMHQADIEIHKLIVALTRTRKQCHLLCARRWLENKTRPDLLAEFALSESSRLS
jgi:hypothetical protein